MVFIDIFPKTLSNGNVNLPDETLISDIYEVTYAGMTSSYTSEISKEEGYKLWRENYKRRIGNGSTYILIFEGGNLKGYLVYNFRQDKQDIFIEDLIISPKYQGDGHTIARLMGCFINQIKESKLDTISTYTNKLNKRMQGILSKSGFSIYEYTDRGIRYSITKTQLIDKYSRLLQEFQSN